MEASLFGCLRSGQASAQGVGYDVGIAKWQERSLILDIRRFA
jgi:hypothetical protein